MARGGARPNEVLWEKHPHFYDPTLADPQAAPDRQRDQDPETWVTGGEPMTGAQASNLQTLSEEAGDAFDATLTKAEAPEKIVAL